MDSDCPDDYPAISKALELLRARLFAAKSTTRDVVGEFSLVSGEHSVGEHSVVEESVEYNLDQHHQPIEKKDDLQSQLDTVGREAELRMRVLEIAHERFAEWKITPRHRPVQSEVVSVPQTVISRLLSFHQRYLVEKYIHAWMLSTKRKRDITVAHETRLSHLQDSFEFWSTALPDTTRISCVQRFGKGKLAQLHNKYRIERQALIQWLQYTLGNKPLAQLC